MESHFPDVSSAQSHRVRERVIDDLHVLAEDTKVMLRATLDNLSARAGQARDQVCVAAKKTDTLIRKHPYESVGIAVAAGIVLGLLLTKKK